MGEVLILCINFRSLIYMLFSIAVVMLGSQELANATDVDVNFSKIQTSSKEHIDDDRIAMLIPAGEDSLNPRLYCTAASIGENTWITATHCVDSFPANELVLRQNEQESATVLDLIKIRGNSDIALLKVSDGIEAENFDLPTREPISGEKVTLVGYGGQYYPTSVNLLVRNKVPKIYGSGGLLTGIFLTEADSGGRGCAGDSGGPVFINNQLLAIHSGGEFSTKCEDKVGFMGYMSPIFPRKDDISVFINVKR